MQTPDWRRAPLASGVAVMGILPARVARISRADAEGVAIAYADGGGECVPARSTVRLDASDVGREVVLVLEDGDPARPIIVGVLQDAPAAGCGEHGASLLIAPPTALARLEEDPHVVLINGKRVEIEAQDELTLRCGKASIILRGDGRIVIKGMEITSRARGTHKVKGATVQIN